MLHVSAYDKNHYVKQSGFELAQPIDSKGKYQIKTKILRLKFLKHVSFEYEMKKWSIK